MRSVRKSMSMACTLLFLLLDADRAQDGVLHTQDPYNELDRLQAVRLSVRGHYWV